MSRRPLILITLLRVPQCCIDILKLKCDLIFCDATNNYDSIYENCKGVHGILWAGQEEFKSDILDAAGDQLQVIATFSADCDYIDKKLLSRRGIVFAATPFVLDETIANMSIGLLLAAARRFYECRLNVENGLWEYGSYNYMLGYDIRGKTVGFYGYSDISKKIIDRLKYFDTDKFIYTIPYIKVEETNYVNIQQVATEVQFNELLRKSDFIFITSSLTPFTENKFNKIAFDKMKKNAILVNTSSAKIIDQTALYNALKNRVIFAAGIDQLVEEPCLPEEPLLTLPNCIITPHIASATKRTREDMSIVAAHNIIRSLEGDEIFL